MSAHTKHVKLTIDGRNYELQVFRQVLHPPEAPRLIVVALQPNKQACALLRICIEAVKRYTPLPHELWIIDNHSPQAFTEWLLDEMDINIVLNRTEPIPPNINTGWRFWRKSTQQERGSYANAIGLEIGRRLIDQETQYLMTMHMDTMPCHPDWLAYLQSKLSRRIKAAGVRMDHARTAQGVLHVLGYLVDFQCFKRLNLDFLPQLPKYDVGDRVSIELRKAGYEVFACRNTLWQPDLIEALPQPFRGLPVDRSLDEDGNVIFLHLGRGVRKASGDFVKGASPLEWVQFAEDYLLA